MNCPFLDVCRKLSPRQNLCRGVRRPARFLLAATLCGLLFGCATAPPPQLRPYVSDAYSTGFTSYGNLHFVRFTSYMTGKRRPSGLPQAIARAAGDGGTAQILAFDRTEPSRRMAAELARQLNAIPAALEALLPVESGRLDLEIILVPRVYSYSLYDPHLLLGRNIRARFAIRAMDDLEVTRRQALRTVAHEVFHATLRVNGISSGVDSLDPAADAEEDAAKAFEVCAELHIAGWTSEDTEDIPSWHTETVGRAPSPYFVSLGAPRRLHSLWEPIFAEGSPVVRADDPRAARLTEVCRQLIAKVLAPPSERREAGAGGS